MEKEIFHVEALRIITRVHDDLDKVRCQLDTVTKMLTTPFQLAMAWEKDKAKECNATSSRVKPCNALC